MKKVLLTLMLGLGLSGVTFAGYTYYGPTQFTPYPDGGYVNCLGYDFMYCVQCLGPSWTPTRGDLITIYDNDGSVIGQYVLQSFDGNPNPPEQGNPQPVGPAKFQVEKSASSTSSAKKSN
jgi:hypothetical protein